MLFWPNRTIKLWNGAAECVYVAVYEETVGIVRVNGASLTPQMFG